MKKPTLSALSESLQMLLLTVPAMTGIALVLRLCVKPEQTLMVMPCVLTGLALLLCAVVYLFLPRFSSLTPLVGIAIGYIALGPANVSRGMFGFLNYLISWWNIAYESGVPLLSVDVTYSNISGFLMLLMLLTASILWYIVQKRNLGGSMLFTLFWFALPMMVGLFPALGCTFLFTAMLGVWLFQRLPGSIRLRSGWFLFVLVLLTGLGLMFRNPTPVAAVHDARTALTQGVHTLRYGSTTLPDGDLYQAHTMLGEPGEETDTLKLTTTAQNALYLRGYVGGRYEDGVWKPLSGNDYGGGNSGMLDWLEQQGVLPQNQYSSYLAAGNTTFVSNDVTVENVGTDRSRLYLPYSAQLSSDWLADAQQDGTVKGTGMLGTRSYAFTDTASTMPGELLQQQEWLTAPATQNEQSYVQAETVYRTFVYDHYLTVDPALQSLIHTTFWPDDNQPANLYTAAQQIRNVLTNEASYSEEPAAVPEDQEPICWFLNGGEGNSALYAATAVEAFRAAGFPARYAEGYLLTAEQAAASSSVTLTTRDSHAWVEVYLDGVGWVPVDVTPGFYLDTYTLQQMVEHPLPILQSSADSNSDSAAQEDSRSENTSTNVTVEWEDPQTGILGILVLLLLLVVIGITALSGRRWYLLWKNGKRLSRRNPVKRQAALCQLIVQSLAILHIECCPGWHNEETEQALCEKMPDFLPGEYCRVAEIMERFAYRPTPLSPAEERLLSLFLQRLWTYRRSLTLAMRFRLRYQFYPPPASEPEASDEPI